MKMLMNLLDRLNGIYSAKSEVPANWLPSPRRAVPLTFLCSRRPQTLKLSMRKALSGGLVGGMQKQLRQRSNGLNS